VFLSHIRVVKPCTRTFTANIRAAPRGTGLYDAKNALIFVRQEWLECRKSYADRANGL